MFRFLLSLPLLCFAVSCIAADQTGSPRSRHEAAAEIPLAAVVIDGRVLFRVRGVSAFPAGQRAEMITDAIVKLARDPGFDPEQLQIRDAEHRTNIMAGERTVMGVFDADGRIEQVDRRTLAEAKLKRIRQAIADYRRDRSPEYLRNSAWLSLGATLAAAAALWLVVRLSRWLDAWMKRRLQSRIQSVGIQSFEILRAEHIFGALQGSLGLTTWVGMVLLVLYYLHYVLRLFPWTRHPGEILLALLVEPFRVMGSALVGKLPNLAFLAVLFILVRYLLKATRFFFDSAANGLVRPAGFQPEWAEPSYKITRLAVIVFALVVAYPYIPGSESAAFRGVSLFLGLMFSLGSSSFLANSIAGYSLIYRRVFKLGDRVKIGDAVGEVIEMRLQVTHLRSFKNEEIIVPNSKILGSEVVNYSSLARQRGLILHTTVGIGYAVPWRQVEAMLLTAAARTPGLLREPAPYVLQRSLGEFAVNYELNVYCNDVSRMLAFYTELHRNILDVFNEYGVQIMTPAYDADPAEPKRVPRERWHAPPAEPEPRREG